MVRVGGGAEVLEEARLKFSWLFAFLFIPNTFCWLSNSLMRLSVFVYKCRSVLSIVENICWFEGFEKFCRFDELFCNTVEGITPFLEFIPRIVILSEECRKQMFNCSKPFEKTIFEDVFTLCQWAALKHNHTVHFGNSSFMKWK